MKTESLQKMERFNIFIPRKEVTRFITLCLSAPARSSCFRAAVPQQRRYFVLVIMDVNILFTSRSPHRLYPGTIFVFLFCVLLQSWTVKTRSILQYCAFEQRFCPRHPLKTQRNLLAPSTWWKWIFDITAGETVQKMCWAKISLKISQSPNRTNGVF